MHKPAPRTDLGTVLLHWSVAATLTISAATGLRIAADTPGRDWLSWMNHMLPHGDVWPWHVFSGLALVGLSVAYVAYVRAAGLWRRIRFDRVRAAALPRSGPARLGALNVALYWLLFAALLIALVTGTLLYLGKGGSIVTIHLAAALFIVVFPLVHGLAQWAYGGLPQLLRIFRPTGLQSVTTQQTKPLADALIERVVQLEQHRHQRAQRTEATGGDVPPTAGQRSARPMSLHANPLAVAMASGLTVVAASYSLDHVGRDTLLITRIDKADAPKLDGDLSDAVWRSARQIVVSTNQGANFNGSGESRVEIRAVHDGVNAYLSFVWEDPTRSLKHLPLIKRRDGWWLLHEAYDIEDEDHYYEDKFAVMLTRSSRPAGGTTHFGPQPLAGAPAAYSGRGLHYTDDGSIADVWHWKAARGGLLGYMDDNYFGAPAQASDAEKNGQSRYKAGYAVDPGKAFYANNFQHEPAGGYRRALQPKRLPRNLATLQAAMGTIDLDPEHGEGEAVRWWMTNDETVPYSPELDATIPVGTVIPGVLIAGEYTGDRADVRCAARWASGRWTLEIVRKLDTASRFDVPIANGTYMWVSAFDHSQTRHTRHARPIKVELR